MNKINLRLIKHVWMNPQLCEIWGHSYSAARQQRNVLSEVYKNKKNAQIPQFWVRFILTAILSAVFASQPLDHPGLGN